MDLFSYLLGAKNSGGGSKIQYDVIPTPDETINGKIIQYVGETDESYTNGYFYIGVSDNEENPTYSWQQLDVQPSPDISEILRTSQASPIIFDNLKKGVYDIFNMAFPLYYKIKSSGEVEMQNLDKSKGIMLYVIQTIKDIEKEYEETPSLTYEKTFCHLYYVDIDSAIASSGAYKQMSFILKRNGTMRVTVNFKDISWLTNTTQIITGVKTFNSIPKQVNTTAPTQDTEFTNKKYVDDLINSISSGSTAGIYTSSYSNLVNMNALKKGVYYPLGNFGNIFYYQINENGIRQNITPSNVSQFEELIILKEQNEITSNNDIVGYLSYVNKSGIKIISELHYIINSNNEITGLTTTTNRQTTNIYLPTNFDGTKTQVLKNVNGTLTWVDE